MKCIIHFLYAILCLPLVVSAQHRPASEWMPDIRFEQFVLPNGLTLIVHEDHKAPIINVSVWYNVGAKDEPHGRRGFAHLFEHLLFTGSENYDHEYYSALEPVGASLINGTTGLDETAYFQTVPAAALDRVLFLESDRMGHLLGAVTQEKLDTQRGVVLNEKRQREDEPYGKVYDTIIEATYLQGHPYDHSQVGSVEDLDVASLSDVSAWYRTYYGPTNAVLVIAGDVTANVAYEKVLHWFGAIPPGPPLANRKSRIAKMTSEARDVIQDRVPQARFYKVWNVPEWRSPVIDYLAIAANVLASGKNSRLFQRLVVEERIASDVSAYLQARSLGSQFHVRATALPGQSLADLERALDEELARFQNDGPTPVELEYAKAAVWSGFARSLERIHTKADILAKGMMYAGDPAFYKSRLQRWADATPLQIKDAANTWLDEGSYTLEVEPLPEYRSITANAADRTRLPDVPRSADPQLPPFEVDSLSNGLKVIVASREGAPVLSLRLLVDAGYAADLTALPGTASLTANMLDEGTESRSTLQISNELERIGTYLATGADADMNTLGLSVLREHLPASLALLADLVINPTFLPENFARVRQELIARIQREKISMWQIADRVIPQLVYGRDHAYGQPQTGSGTEEGASVLTRDNLTEFHRRWFRPNNATLVVVGATSMAEVKPMLQKSFGPWQSAHVPAKEAAPVKRAGRQKVYLIDRAGEEQAFIFASLLVPPRNSPQRLALEVWNDIVGGALTSRINMNLREENGWTYGAFTSFSSTRGWQILTISAPVQADKTKESIQEIVKELQDIIGARPITEEELAKAQANLTLSLLGRWETNDAVADAIADISRFELSDGYFDRFTSTVNALTLDDLSAVATQNLHLDRLTWLIVGDRQQIQEGIREVLGDFQLMDADGLAVPEAAP